MDWPLMSPDELHEFGIDTILPYVEKEGVSIESVNVDLKSNPQIVGRRWEKLAFIYVRTDCYPLRGQLTDEEFHRELAWADSHQAIPFFASVGILCSNFPDKTEVTTPEHMSQPYRHAGFDISYPGLKIMSVSDRVQLEP